jgi:GT2 family glycosyltransferase
MLQTVLMRANVMRQLGGFDSTFRVLPDREFWIRFTAAGFKARYMPEPVAWLDRGGGNRFTRNQKRYLALELAIVDKHAALYESALGKRAGRIARSKILRRSGGISGGVRGRLRYLRGCLMAAEWSALLRLCTTGRMSEVPYTSG